MNLDHYLFTRFSETDSRPVTVTDLLKQCKESKNLTSETKTLQSPEYKIGDGLLAYLRVMVAEENDGDAEAQAKKLLTFFGNTDEGIHEILTYLDQYVRQHKNAAAPIYDACLFELPINQNGWDKDKLPIWRQLAKKRFHYEKWFMDLLPQARDIEKDLGFSDKIEKEKLLKVAAALTYTPDLAEQDSEAAKLFMKHKVPKEIFTEYLGLKFVDDRSIPNIKLQVYLDEKGKITILSVPPDDGKLAEPKKASKKALKKVSKKEPTAIYTIEKLTSEAEAALLGHFTGDCQHLGANGRTCTIHGITDPASGFYVVRNSKKRSLPIPGYGRQKVFWYSTLLNSMGLYLDRRQLYYPPYLESWLSRLCEHREQRLKRFASVLVEERREIVASISRNPASRCLFQSILGI